MNIKTDILNELKELSPLLLQLKEKERTPEVSSDYFGQLTDNVVAEIKTTSGLLASLKKEKTEVPAGYFETFGEEIVTRIKAEEKGKTPELSKQKTRIYQLFTRVALAASVVGAIFLIKHIQQPVLPVNDCTDGIACLTQEEIYNYMNANSHEFDVQQIQEVVKPLVDTIETKIDIETKDATQYIEENKLILDVYDSSTDIF